LSTTNPTCCPDANPGRRGGKPATNRLSYGTAYVYILSLNMFDIVAAIFHQIMTELTGAETEEDRIVAITKIVLKLIKQNGCYTDVDDIYC
jgi:hypothetical protein